MEKLDAFSVLLTAWGEQSGHVYKAFCPELCIWAVGFTPEEAQSELREKARLLLLSKRDAYQQSSG